MTAQEIMNQFNALTSDERIPILFKALNRMQGYNGRSIDDCIIYAMGYLPNVKGEYIKVDTL